MRYCIPGVACLFLTAYKCHRERDTNFTTKYSFYEGRFVFRFLMSSLLTATHHHRRFLSLVSISYFHPIWIRFLSFRFYCDLFVLFAHSSGLFTEIHCCAKTL